MKQMLFFRHPLEEQIMNHRHPKPAMSEHVIHTHMQITDMNTRVTFLNIPIQHLIKQLLLDSRRQVLYICNDR